MFKKMLCYAGMTSILFLGACGGDSGEAENPSTDDLSAGEELYQQNSCIGCHGSELEGASGPNLQNVGDRLAPEEIEEVIVEGRGQMRGGLITDEEELDTIVEWLSSQTEE